MEHDLTPLHKGKATLHLTPPARTTIHLNHLESSTDKEEGGREGGHRAAVQEPEEGARSEWHQSLKQVF